jgi:predicted ribonuclease YlaK
MISGLYLPGNTYVLNLDAALNFPEMLDIDKSAPICQRLIVPINVYNQKLSQWEDEDSDRGASAIELSKYLVKITERANVIYEDNKFYFEYTYEKGQKLILDPRNHDGNSNSSSTHTIACAQKWKAAIITSKSAMVTGARMRGIEAYFLKPSIYTGYRIVEMPMEYISGWERHGLRYSDWADYFNEEPLRPNEFVEFVYEQPERPRKYKNIGMFNPRTQTLEHLQFIDDKCRPKSVYPRNARQAMAFEAAYAPADRITVAVFYGNAGSGKTFISLGAAFAQTDLYLPRLSEMEYQGQNSKRRQKQRKAQQEIDEGYSAAESIETIIKPYHEIWCCPPDRMMGDKLGAVPGDRWQKLRDNLDGYSQNIKAFLEAQHNRKAGGEDMTYRDIEMQAESIMRSIHFTSAGQVNGNSFSNTVFLIDEAEFMKEAQIRTFIERIADNSKIFICGDPTQIQNPYGWYGNPLAKAIRRLAGDEQVAILKFDRDDEIQRPGAKIASRCWDRDK